MRPTPQLRSHAAADDAFLLQLFASTRTLDIAALPLPQEEIDALIAMQCAAQDRHYRAHFPAARFSIVMSGDDRVGRLVVERSPHMMLLVDIALLPTYRSQRIGTQLLEALIQECGQLGVPLRCHVDPDSPARHLYERLGFVTTGQDGHLLRMEHPCLTSPR